MRLFRCAGCGQLLFFENSLCLRCGRAFGFDPLQRVMLSAEPCDALRRCSGGDATCNWLVAADDPENRCLSCRATVENPGRPGGPPATDEDLARWNRLEKAKRRLFHTLLHLRLPLADLRFAFPSTGTTGYGDGLITVVLSEADDAERERRRIELREPYRTLTGHLRHESGHHFFPRLVRSPPVLDEVRRIFGDERADYPAALKQHYANGPLPGWEASYVSAYATSHPSEDWAETWAHYLHIIDAVELATAYGLSLAPQGAGSDGRVRTATGPVDFAGDRDRPFEAVLETWTPLTYFANSLNRSIGLQDWYPFALPDAVIAKLHLMHRVITTANGTPAQAQPATAGAGQAG